MRKYARLLASYGAIAITAMVLYTPWLVGLTPSDPSILRAGLSVICGLVLTGAFGASTYAYLHEPEYRLLESGEVTEADDVLPQLKGLSELPLVGSYAQEAASQVESMEHRRGRLYRVIEATFGAESLSHDKFVAVVDQAHRTLLRNCALLANRVLSFDVEGYSRARRQIPADVTTGSKGIRGFLEKRGLSIKSVKSANNEGYRKTRKQLPASPSSTSTALMREQMDVYQEALSDMQEVIEANERLLLEMGKLEMEISDLESDDNREDNTRMLDEVQDLLEQTKYYR